ncbi:U-box domain-containing 44-like [Olea europaea subsp. europaea]|uniref:RING-type E3 ubiquitin transferase n=1 Tax=Olea europaea subsp. europaea TaxID=158383 RepID=A0A8S0P6L8_OLEEU|nr:U-box domain-containing 44-like [Olea europaea subsp. europaea]
MVMDVITNPSLGPIMEVLSQTIEAIIEVSITSKNVLIKEKSFQELSSYLDRIIPLLRELNRKDISDSKGLENFVEILYRETKVAKQLIGDCRERNRFYLFVNSRSIAKRIEEITKEITHAMSCIPLASIDISVATREDIDQLVNNMRNAEFRAALAEEEILGKIESGIQERNVDRSYANNLLVSIAKAVGVPTDRAALKKEFEEFKSEIENLRLRKDKAEAIQMDQIIALLERAEVASSLEEREKRYLMKRASLGNQPLEPLQSFYCPITKEVMVDPVETPSGHTYERSAIEKWLEEQDGHLCPMTLTPLDTSMLRPNKTLRQSIEEWKDRNTMIILTSLKSRLSSGVDEEVLQCLEQLQDLCEQREMHREWIVLENYIPCLTKLLRAKNGDIRKRALVILCLLGKDNDDAKERIARVRNGMELIAKSLGRRIGEGKLAAALLLELSKCESVRKCIGNVQGCILLLVTMLSGDDNQAARYAKNILDNLSFSDDNVILMAKNNYFKYLLQRLSSGHEDVKIRMAKTLGEMELTDHNKSSLVEEGVLDLLLVLISHDNVEMSIVAIGALLNLSTLRKNSQEMIRKGVMRPLLDILFSHKSSQSLRELVAAVLVKLSQSTTVQHPGESQVLMLESDEDIYKLFSLINLTGPAVQENILQALYALCLSTSGITVREKLRQYSAVQVLVRLCELDDLSLRANAVKLLYCVTENNDGTAILEHVERSSIEVLLNVMRTSKDEEEIAYAMGIIAHLPDPTQISGWLLESGGGPIIFSFLPDDKNSCHQRSQLIENAVGAICHLTVPTNLQSQKKVAEAGIIPVLVQLLEVGTSLTRRQAAISLGQLSVSSPTLSRRIPRHQGFWCFSAIPEAGCPVHGGICTVESSFCLLEAGAVVPLVGVLGQPEPGACEAALDALLTLIDSERLQCGSKVLVEANALPVMIKLISGPPRLQEKVLSSLERIFRLVEIKQKYGPSAQMSLIDLTQRGNNSLRPLAARILAQLNVLHDQSSYF